MPKIKEEIPTEVWATVQNGSKEDYAAMISRDEFHDALYEYYDDLVKSFLFPTADTQARKEDILQVGGKPVNVQVLIVSEDLDNKPTANCYKRFSHSALQAILFIPKSAREEEYSWYRCSFGWPKMYLKLVVEGNELTNIRLVGVSREGKTEKLQLRVSRAIAQRLDLPGWETYDSNAFGTLTVSSVE